MSTADHQPDFSMYELYQQELNNNEKAILEAFDKLQAGDSPTPLLTKLQTASHQITGAAKIIRIKPTEIVAQQLEAIVKKAKDKSGSELAQIIDEAKIALKFLARSKGFKKAEELIKWNNTATEQAVELFNKLTPGANKSKQKKPTPKKTITPQTDSSGAEKSSLTDSSMLALFRTEAETQLEILSIGLVESEEHLEDPHALEPLMRAAHSLKGAARIVGFDGIVALAHVMEDIFVATQHGKLVLESEYIDVLLRTLDWLIDRANGAPVAIEQWNEKRKQEYQQLLDALNNIKEGTFDKYSASKHTEKQLEPEIQTAFSSLTEDTPTADTLHARHHNKHDAVIKVSIDSINRLMSLAAESLVETRRLAPFRDTLIKIKENQAEFASRLDNIRHLENEPSPKQERVAEIEQLRQLANQNLDSTREQIDNFDNLSRNYTLITDRLYREVLQSRMRPFADGIIGFPRLVRDLSRTLGKKVNFKIKGKDTPVDRDILGKLDASLTHIIRNALDHALETSEERLALNKPDVGELILEARHRAGMLVVEIKDDGRGIDVNKIKKNILEKKLLSEEVAKSLSNDEILQFLFLPGFSTHTEVTEISGRGVGLDVVHSLMQDVGGQAKIITEPDKGSTFILQVPVTRSVIRALMVDINGEAYAFPLSRIVNVMHTKAQDLQVVENRQYFTYDKQNVGLVSSCSALGFSGYASSISPKLTIVIVKANKNYYGIEVDELIGESDLVVRALDSRFGKVPGINTAAITEEGDPLLILDIDDLVQSIDKLLAEGLDLQQEHSDAQDKTKKRKRVLIVDDSLTVRETERQLLDNAGYIVEVAVDGGDGWNAVRLGDFDLIVSDIDMPRLSGFELIKKIRKDTRLAHIPIIIVSYKDREEDRQKGLEAGADHYLTKSSFQDQTFVQVVEDLIGKADS